MRSWKKSPSAMIDTNETLGQVAVAHPASTLVFLRHRLDFCWGGSQPLVEACREAGLDPAAIVAEIEADALEGSTERWDDRPLADLVGFIVERFHETLRRALEGRRPE